MEQETKQLLHSRGEKYGNTHELAGLVIGLLKEPYTHLIEVAPQFSHNWVIMLSKLIRMLFDPYHLDNYDDIIGYATLSKELAEGEKDDTISTRE